MNMKKYDKIGEDYDFTRKADKLITEKFINHLEPKVNNIYLDIGCGTGNYTIAFQNKGFDFIGIAPSSHMIKKAILKNSNIDWKIGSAESTGLPNNSVNGIISTLTLHHWKDLNLGFSELNRVLKTNGIIVIFTSIQKQMEGYWLNHYFPKTLSKSIHQMPNLKQITSTMSSNDLKVTALEKYFVQNDIQDKFLYSGKHQPESYLNSEIRNGISSFSSLANCTEVNQGLNSLRSYKKWQNYGNNEIIQ